MTLRKLCVLSTSALVFVSGLACALDGEELCALAPYPSPRLSGSGRVAFAASNVQLLGWVPLSDFQGGPTSVSDCWGYTSPAGREYAVVGLSNATGFVEVTDPGEPRIVAVHPSPASLWRCLKTYQSFAYAGSEGGGGLQVFDLADIDSGLVSVSSTPGGTCTAATHTLAVDETSGFLYRAGGGGSCGGVWQGLQIYSLANPAEPVLVGQWNPGRYVHECQVVTWELPGPYLGRQLAFCFSNAGPPGTGTRTQIFLQILDVTDKAEIRVVSSTSYPGAEFSHQGWTSTDRQFLYLDDELDLGSLGTRIFSLANLAAPRYLGSFDTGTAAADHNLYVKDNRIYEANYRGGLHVFDDTNPVAPVEVGFFDTHPEDDLPTFNSLWSNYPFFASGTILGGDVEKGLFVWREGAAKLTFGFPDGMPQSTGADGGALRFTVSESAPGELLAGTVQLCCSTGGEFTAVAAVSLGDELYEAPLPAVPCGSPLDFYVRARSADDVTWTDPPAAPTQVHHAAFGGTLVHQETMESELGWSVDLAQDLGAPVASTGNWTRLDPLGTAAQPEDDAADLGSSCWVTGQGTLGGAVGEADVDGGATALRSPVLDASGLVEPAVSYWRWFSNIQGASPGVDALNVDISNDGGASWVPLETVGPLGHEAVGGWFRHTVRIASLLQPTGTVCLRFVVADVDGAIVEAALDDLQLLDLNCVPASVTVDSLSPGTGSFQGGNRVTITGTGFQPTTTVTFGSSPASAVRFVSGTTLEVRVPRFSGSVSGRLGAADLGVDVTVQNPGSAVLTDGYLYQLTQKSR